MLGASSALFNHYKKRQGAVQSSKDVIQRVDQVGRWLVTSLQGASTSGSSSGIASDTSSLSTNKQYQWVRAYALGLYVTSYHLDI